MQEEYEDEPIVYQEQKKISNTKARVTTKILRRSSDIPVIYSMLQRNDAWKIYDVNIEGVSLVKNYRTQFSKILINIGMNSNSLMIESDKNYRI
jgi:phospholipid transport system substrate-binding protein